MNTLYDQCQRCMRHPHQRIVGVCSSCLQERLTSLIEPLSPPDATKCDNVRTHGLALNNHDLAHEHEKEPPVLSDANLPNNVMDGIAEMVPRSNGDTRMQGKVPLCIQTGSTSTMAPWSHEDMRSSRAQTVRHARHSADFTDTARYSNQNDDIHIDAKEALVPSHMSLDKRYRVPLAQHRQTDVSIASRGDALGKKKASWFVVSKSKNALLSTPIQVDDRKFSKYGLKSPQNNVASASQAVGSTSDACRHTHMSDLEAIAEINMGNPISKIENNINRDAGTSSSWISSLFHRRKWPRSKSSLSNSSGSSISNMAIDTTNNGIITNESNSHLAQSSIDAGRRSWDGARPNFKQLLKRIEARNKQQRPDFSPSQFVDYAMKEYNDNGREIMSHATFLQKSKSVASARSSISVEMPKDLMQSSLSPRIHQGQSNVMVGLEYDTFYDDRNLRRSRSWGRTWNRALSPLWGSRSHRHKGVTQDMPSSTHQQNHLRAGSATPSHVNLKGGATHASSSHLSPLRRSNLAPDARIRLAH